MAVEGLAFHSCSFLETSEKWAIGPRFAAE